MTAVVGPAHRPTRHGLPALLAAVLATACGVFALAATLGPAAGHAADARPRHVFVIVLENENASETFAKDSPAPYLAKTLRSKGQYLPNYYGVTHLSLGNYLAMISGQGSNPQTQSDCQLFTNFVPGTIGPDGQALGSGCVYPSSVKTVADQLTGAGLTWKGYMEDMGNSATEPETCRHPAIGAHDETQSAEAGDQYAARHNPFVYFHSIIDSPDCGPNDVPLDRLQGDLATTSSTANYNLITPNLCNDGHDAPCVDGRPGGLRSANSFLKTWVPRILASPAYRKDGMLVVTFDEAESSGSEGDGRACCHEPQFPNTPNNGGTIAGRGGGRIGAVILSPFTEPGSVNPASYNHFSLLRSTENLFGLAHLGYAASPNPGAFGADVFNASKAASGARPHIRLRHVPHHCRRGAFSITASVREQLALRRLSIYVDSRLVRRTTHRSASATIRVHGDRLRRHRITVKAASASGRHAQRSVAVCAGAGGAGASFTG